MTLAVHTARIGHRDPDVLDVTRKSAGPDGIAFAPSWAILKPALDALRCAESMRSAADAPPFPEADPVRYAEGAEAMRRAAETVRGSTWALYSAAYLAEMRESYRTQRAAWDALLARERVVLVCYCTDAERCHRTPLARDILPRLGAQYAGEVRR